MSSAILIGLLVSVVAVFLFEIYRSLRPDQFIYEYRPKRFSQKIDARYIKTINFQGYTKNLDQLFTDEVSERFVQTYHVFQYSYGNSMYEFRFQTMPKIYNYESGTLVALFIQPRKPTRCWFSKKEITAYTIEET